MRILLCCLWLVSILAHTPVIAAQPNSDFAMQQLLQMQKELGKLQAEIQHLQTQADKQNTQQEIQQLTSQINDLNSAQSGQRAEIDQLGQRGSDVGGNISLWGFVFTFLTVLVAIGSVWLGFSAKARAIAEAKAEAKVEAKVVMEEELSSAKATMDAELNSAKQLMEKEISAAQKAAEQAKVCAEQANTLVKQVSESEKAAKNSVKTIERLQNSITNKDAKPSQAENEQLQKDKNDIKQALQNKSEQDYSANDWYAAGLNAYSDDNKAEATKCWQQVINDESASQRLVATALFNLGLTYGEQQDPAQEIATYKKLLSQFEHSQNQSIQETLAHALVNLGCTYGKQQDPEQEIATYNKLLNQFEDHSNQAIQEQVAKALFNLGVTYKEQKQPEQAIATFQQLLSQFKDSQDPAIQAHLAGGTANWAELSLLFEDTDSLLLIAQAEQFNPAPSLSYTCMQFCRFLLDDKPFAAVIQSVTALDDKAKFSWKFDEIRAYLAQFTGVKKQQVDCFVEFVEQHHDKDRFIKQAEAL